MSMIKWAENEVKIACQKENPDMKDGEFDYGCACYESALKAYKSLMADGHSGMSFSITRSILIQLMNGRPLTPIEDTDDVWNEITSASEEYTAYQCKRMSSFFKQVYENGTVKYKDINRAYCIDVNHPQNKFSGGLGDRILDEIYPISTPYMPSGKIKIYTEDFLIDPNHDDYDTFGVLFFSIQNGDSRMEINRFFRKPETASEHCAYPGWVEIDQEEYNNRRKLANMRQVAEYCDNDVLATEAVFNARKNNS